MKHYRSGDINTLVIVVIAMGMVIIGLGVVSIWLLTDKAAIESAKEAEIASAVAVAERDTKMATDKYWQERMLDDKIEFNGPSDLGALTFRYPRIWNMHITNDGTRGSSFEAYFHIDHVPMINKASGQYNLRVEILNQQYDTFVARLANSVQKGDLTARPLVLQQVSLVTGTRYDGALSREIRGSQAVFKFLDKTIIIRTDFPDAKSQRIFQDILDSVRLRAQS